jgi:hypothetical protein
MAILLTSNRTVEDILTEVEKFDALERQVILAYIRAKLLRLEKKTPIAKYARNVKLMTMAEIDAIKHESRAGYARK